MGFKARIVAHDMNYSKVEDPGELPPEAMAYVVSKAGEDGKTQPVVAPLVTIHFEPEVVPNGKCPCCGKDAPEPHGVLVSPPIKKVLAALKGQHAAALGKEPNQVSDQEVVPFMLALHGGFFAVCGHCKETQCAQCAPGHDYFVRVTEWPETSLETVVPKLPF